MEKKMVWSQNRGIHKTLLVLTVVAALLTSLSVASAGAGNNKGNMGKGYKNLLETIDGSITALRFDADAVIAWGKIRNQYNDVLVGDEDFEKGTPDYELNVRIDNVFDSFVQGNEVGVENVQKLRDDIKKMASLLGIGLPFYFEHSILIILLISFGLAFVINLTNREVVDWERVNVAKARISKWQKELREAQRKGKKKRIRKLQQRQSDLLNEQKKVMGATLKPMIFYMVPFFLFWWAMSNLYGGWVVAWVPFEFPWPDLGFRLFSGSFVSLGFLGWYLLSYFGFAQVWRKFLIPD